MQLPTPPAWAQKLNTDGSVSPQDCVLPHFKAIKITKKFGEELGLSCAYRQHLMTNSPNQFLHGYALGVEMTFLVERLDTRDWVVDLGWDDWAPLGNMLRVMFAHKTLVAIDDPALDQFRTMHELGLCRLLIVPATGCEAFSAMVHADVSLWLEEKFKDGAVRLLNVVVSEHGAYSAQCEG